MLYIYIALFLSSSLCLIGLVLSIIDLETYNFGLYIALVAIVAFTVALAFFVVKPRACLRPAWFLKLFGQNLITDRSAAGDGRVEFNGPEVIAETEDGGRRVMFFGYDTAAFLRSEIQAGYMTRDSDSTINATPAVKLLELSTPTNRFHHPTTGAVHFGLSSENKDAASRELKKLPSTTLIPPTPPSLDAQDEIQNLKTGSTSTTRVRAWTYTCAATAAVVACPKLKRGDSSSECAKQWQNTFLRNNRNLFLRSSFPLSERMPALLYSSKFRTCDSSIESDAKSWSTEEVVDLDEFLRSNASASREKLSKTKNSDSTRDHQPIDNFPESEQTKPPIRKDNLFPKEGDSHSWRRSHTVTVKYVPVKEEWISRPVIAPLRKKSRSTNTMFTMLNGSGDNSPWWCSVTSLFRRADMTRNDSCHRV